MVPLLKENVWHRLFRVGLAVKAFNGIWGTVSGCAFLFISKATLSGWFLSFARSELIDDPNDVVMNFVVHTLLSPSTSTKTFAALYVLFHGLINLFLAILLYRDKHWAYPTTVGLMALSLVYQIYRIGTHHSLILTVITVFDVIYMMLVWHEYKNHTERKPPLSGENNVAQKTEVA